MHQLARSIVIFDEIQTLPVRTVHMFCNALNFLVGQCGTTAVLCTATQPLLEGVNKHLGALKFTQKSEIVSRDLTELFARFHRVEIINRKRDGGYSCEEIAALALEEQKIFGSVLVVANTRKAAQEIYRCVKKDFEHVRHLSANMCPAHRKEVLAGIRKRLDDSLPVVCVSTQVIEAGIDIDFGAGIRVLAGLDSVAQTSGRVNRNALRSRGRVLLVNLAEENLKKLPDIDKGKSAAERILDDFKEGSDLLGPDLLDPKTIARYFDYYFYNRKGEMSYAVKKGKMSYVTELERDDTLLNMLSSNVLARGEYVRIHGEGSEESLKNRLQQSFASAAAIFRAIDAPTRGIIVQYGEGKDIITKLCGSFDPEKDSSLLHRAQQYSVNVYPHVWKKLDGIIEEVQAGTDIWYLPGTYYSADFGLSEELVEKFPPAHV
jgi:CRISPR-associated endonuclease/helicase Cas3